MTVRTLPRLPMLGVDGRARMVHWHGMPARNPVANVERERGKIPVHQPFNFCRYKCLTVHCA